MTERHPLDQMHAAARLAASEPPWMDIVRQAYHLGHNDGSAGYSPMTADELDTWISAVCAKRGSDV